MYFASAHLTAIHLVEAVSDCVACTGTPYDNVVSWFSKGKINADLMGNDADQFESSAGGKDNLNNQDSDLLSER